MAPVAFDGVGVPSARPGATALIICSANVCRSPAAAAVLHHVLGGAVTVVSAGVWARPGQPACPSSSAWAGLDPGAHRSYQVDSTLVGQADLVLTMTRDQRSELLRMAPLAQARCFTLPQAARIADWWLDQRRGGPLIAAPNRLVAMVAELDAARGLAPRANEASDDDIPDPHGRGAAAHQHAFDRIGTQLDALAWLWQAFGAVSSDAVRTG